MSESRSYQAVPITGEGDAVQHRSFALVIALFTLGCRQLESGGFIETLEMVGTGADAREVRTFTWLFQPKSVNGKYKTATLVEAWNDPERAWFKKNPEDPFTYLEAAHRHDEHVRAELAKNVPLGIVRKGDRFVMIPMDATSEEEAALMAKLNKAA